MPVALPDATEDELRAIIARHADLEGALLPILHELQETYGHIPAASAPLICAALNISKAELHGVISFYHDFRDAPAGRHVLKLCRAEACKAVGADALAEALLRKLGIDWHGTTGDGAVTIEPVYCLGLCACGPAAMLDEQVVGRADAEKLDRLLAGAGA
ncbi:MAG: formate dehydrogenase subunit gamma [Rhodobacteraceae bacterium]|nr:formate dehydrogenase subunit gamma [Paracoccaceae bacterium]